MSKLTEQLTEALEAQIGHCASGDAHRLLATCLAPHIEAALFAAACEANDLGRVQERMGKRWELDFDAVIDKAIKQAIIALRPEQKMAIPDKPPSERQKYKARPFRWAWEEITEFADWLRLTFRRDR